MSAAAAAAWAPSGGQQTKFMTCQVREVLGGGAAGGGKSELLLAFFLYLLAFEHARWQKTGKKSTAWCIHFRRVMPRLLQTINRAHLFYKRVDPGVRYHENTHIFTFSCGLKIQFAHMEKENSYLDYLGQEYVIVEFDELTEFTEEQYKHLCTRVRTSDPELTQFLAIRSASNPIGAGLIWVRKYFVDPYPEGEKPLKVKVTLPDGTVEHTYRMFIPFRLRDNVNKEGVNRLGRDYLRTLSGQSKHVREALLDGNWYITPGAFFGSEWDRNFHVVKPFKVPLGWQRFRSGDYGYSDPSAIAWWAVDPDGNLFCYRSLTVKKHTAEMLAYRIREIEEAAGEWDKAMGRSRLTGPLDPACFAKTGHIGPSLAEGMIMLGVGWFPADNERKAGWNQLRQRLIARNKSPLLDPLGIENEAGHKLKEYPQIMWFSSCKSPVKTIPALPTDANDCEDADTKANDHDADAVRYECMARPVSGKKEERPWYEDELGAVREKRRGAMGYPGAW